MNFEITDEMMDAIREWDSCTPIDVTGAKFEYILFPQVWGLSHKLNVMYVNEHSI